MRKAQAIGKLIGKKVKVKNASNRSLIGISGEVIDETKNMLTLRTAKGKKLLIKAQVELALQGQ